jgi:hypothetical protein
VLKRLLNLLFCGIAFKGAPYTLYSKISYSWPVYNYWKMLSRYAPRFITKHSCFEYNTYSILIMLFTVIVYLARNFHICHLIWHCSNRQIGVHAFVANIKPSWLYILSDIYILQGTLSVTTPCTCAKKGECVLLPTCLIYQGSLKPTSKLMKLIHI